MGFADMDFKLLLPDARGIRGEIAIRLARSTDGSTRLRLSRRLRDKLRITTHVEVLVSTRAIAIRGCAPNAQGARRISTKNGEINASVLADLFHIELGESYRLETEIDAPHAIGYLPDALVLRIKQRRGRAA